MILEQPAHLEQCQRIQVILDKGEARCCRITVERFDVRLGWYTAATLDIPVHQLPLLQQALSQAGECTDSAAGGESDRIIPFPTLMNRTAA